MLIKFSNEQKLDEVATVYASDYMDCGSKINLALTISRKDKTAHFDFTGTSP